MSALKETWKDWRRERREAIEVCREAGVRVALWEVAVALGAVLAVVALSVGSSDGCSTSRFGVAKGLLSEWVESLSLLRSWSTTR